MNMIIRILTAVLGLAALLAVAALWFNPDGIAQTLGLTLNGAAGRAIVRGDLAGLFLALGIFSLLAAVYQHGNYAKAALILTAAIFLGRVINLIVGGVAPALLLPGGLELMMMAVYYNGVRIWRSTKS
jgi:hypothetical protein